jgi:hypothetical protein
MLSLMLWCLVSASNLLALETGIEFRVMLELRLVRLWESNPLFSRNPGLSSDLNPSRLMLNPKLSLRTLLWLLKGLLKSSFKFALILGCVWLFVPLN